MKQKTDNNSNTETNEERQPFTTGTRLRQIREEKSISIEEVSQATKISPANIQAMENEDFDKLPADPFLKGQIILYCKFLGINGTTIANEFIATRKKNHLNGSLKYKSKQNTTNLNDRKLSEPTHVSSIILALLVLGAIIISLTILCIATSWNPFVYTGKQETTGDSTMQRLVIDENAQQIPAPEDKAKQQSPAYKYQSISQRYQLMTNKSLLTG